MRKLLTVCLLMFGMAFLVPAQTELAKKIYAQTKESGANIEKIINQGLKSADSVSCHDLGVLFYLDTDFVHAAQCIEITLTKLKKHAKNYESHLQTLSYLYLELNDTKGMERVMALTEEHNQYQLKLPCNEPDCMLERAEYYAASGDNAKAKECYLKALSMNLTTQQKSAVYESYALYNSDIKEFITAYEYYVMAANATKEMEGKTESYAQLLYKAAVWAFVGKAYPESEKLYRQVLAFYESQHSELAQANMALCHKGLGNTLSGMKNYAGAAKEHQWVVDYYKRTNTDNDEYPKAIVRVATAEKFNKDYDNSIAHYKEAMAIMKERGMVDEYQKASTALNLCYNYAGRSMEHDEEMENRAKTERIAKLDQIIKEEQDNLENYRKYAGKLVYSSSLATIAGCYQLKGEYGKSIAYYQQYIQALRDALRYEFVMQSESARKNTWKVHKENLDELKNLLVELPAEDSLTFKQLAGIAYDCMLISKGIMLNSVIEFEKVLAEGNDKHLQDIYAQTKVIEGQLEILRNHALNEKNMQQITNLSQQHETLILELYKGCSEMADYTQYLSYSWQDVQKSMQSSDVAMEFVSIETSIFDNDNWLVALVLTKNMKVPEIVPVCTFDVLKYMQNDSLMYETPIMGQLVWENMDKYVKDKKRIFFAADGAFQQLGIEYLPYYGSPLSEQKEVYRLSSTKELCRPHRKIEYNNIVLIGDVDYNEDAMQISSSTQEKLMAMRGPASGEAWNGLANLDNTRREINDIKNTLEKNTTRTVARLSGKEATREAFLSLSESKINLIHIATHGMYLSQNVKTDAESMQNCLLAFSGINLNDALASKGIGIVNAEEIAQMNFRDCDLAVLSACETGLGKLGSDGVFGLQRGFKNAGVHSLMISLRSVNDASTAELMTAFYKYLLEGKSKREALVLAQKDVRAKGYIDALHWTSFILLDALE